MGIVKMGLFRKKTVLPCPSKVGDADAFVFGRAMIRVLLALCSYYTPSEGEFQGAGGGKFGCVGFC